MALPFDEGKAFLRVGSKYPHDGFGADTGGRKLPHTGIDINTIKWRDTTVRIRSVWGGEVVSAGYDREAGWYVIVHEHDGGFWIYGHHTENLVAVGDTVPEGGVIARIGMSGQSTGVHCHVTRARSLAAALASIHGITPTKRGKTTAQWADKLGLTDPFPWIEKSLAARPQEHAAAAAEQSEEDELMGARDDIIKELKAHIDNVSQSRTRADVRGYVHLDLGPEGSLPIEQALHAVLIAPEGILVLHPPAVYGMGQINSLISGSGEGRTDYRWLDSQRWASPLVTARFINRVKDSLTARNYFGDDRQVTADQAWAWIAKHEAAKAAEASGQ